VVTLLQVSTPWPCSHFSTAMSVAGDGWTRSRTCSRDRNWPARHGEGQRTLLPGPGGARHGSGTQPLPYCADRGSEMRLTSWARRPTPRCRRAKVSCTSWPGLTRPAWVQLAGTLWAGCEGQAGPSALSCPTDPAPTGTAGPAPGPGPRRSSRRPRTGPARRGPPDTCSRRPGESGHRRSPGATCHTGGNPGAHGSPPEPPVSPSPRGPRASVTQAEEPHPIPRNPWSR